MKDILEWIEQSQIVLTIIRVAVPVIVGIPLTLLLASMAARVVRNKYTQQAGMLVRKAITYTGVILVLIMVLNQLGFQLTALLGAAGIAGIAIGFASQTSVSNVISGVFLISEKPFQVGDLIRVGDTLGVVQSIDLLSVKLRKLDNLFVRIPNEMMIKSEVTNVTRFPIRRMDIDIGVAYKEDAGRVMEILADIAEKNPWCLDEPEPLILFKNFGDSALEFLFGVWFLKTDYLLLRNSIMPGIKERFDREGIEIPFPHRSLYAGSDTEPFPIRLVSGAAEGLPGAMELA